MLRADCTRRERSVRTVRGDTDRFSSTTIVLMVPLGPSSLIRESAPSGGTFEASIYQPRGIRSASQATACFVSEVSASVKFAFTTD